ncbi:MAG: integrin alpha, partial [Pseudomonadota bacterium]|nr:integrin alpha [Pseudomonadota bacterium]
NDYAGSSVSGAGDVNGDGYDDMFVGAPYNADGGTYAGAAFLLLGSAAPASASLSTATQYTGEAVDDSAGSSVSSAGDVDGDGYDDMLVGRPTGAAYLVLGSAAPASASLTTATQYTGEAAGDGAGSCVSGAGDVNGDGYDDMLVGAYGNDDAASDGGAAYLLLSPGL